MFMFWSETKYVDVLTSESWVLAFERYFHDVKCSRYQLRAKNKGDDLR